MYTYQEIFSPCSDKLSIWISKEDKWRKKLNINISSSSWRTVLEKKQLTSRGLKERAEPGFECRISTIVQHLNLNIFFLLCHVGFHIWYFLNQIWFAVLTTATTVLLAQTRITILHLFWNLKLLFQPLPHRRNAKGKECFNNVWITTKVKLE